MVELFILNEKTSLDLDYTFSQNPQGNATFTNITYNSGNAVFNGSSSKIDIPLDLKNSKNIEITVKYKHTGNGSSGTDPYGNAIFSLNDSSLTGFNGDIILYSTSDGAGLTLDTGGVGASTDLVNITNSNSSMGTFEEVRFSYTGQVISIYLDGVFLKSIDVTLNLDNIDRVRLGNIDANLRYFEGEMEYFRINSNSHKEKADLYKDETIQLTDTIQDVKDIAKVFTPFTQAFKLPASATNNKLFQHYYNADIDGFDARYRTDAIIKIDGADYRKGKIALNKVDLKDGQPISYDVNFFGNTVALTELLGEDELKDLGTLSDGSDNPVLSSYNFSYSSTFVKNGFSVGQQSESLIFPFISAKNYYLFDSTNSGGYGFDLPDGAEARNINSDGVLYNDLKPALLVTKVLEAIETKYNIDFSNDFFSHPDIEKLYLWLHREKGSVEEQLSLVESDPFLLSELTLVPGEFEHRKSLSGVDNNALNFMEVTPQLPFTNDKQANIKFTTNTPDSGSYIVELLSDVYAPNGSIIGSNYLVKEVSNLTGSYNFVFEGGTQTFFKNLIGDSSGVNSYYIKYKVVIKSFTNTQFSLSNFYLRSKANNWESYTNDTSNKSLSGQISTLASQLPKMKTIDFLRSFFKMFNLTTYFDGSQLVVKSLDDYYATGNTYDITKYIDASSYTVSRSNVYRNISFEFPEAKTFAVYKANSIQSNTITNKLFGHLNFEDRDIDGGKYEVKVDFEKFMYERMSDQSNGDRTNYQWGWFCDENKNTYVNKPLLFYAVKYDQSINFDDGNAVSSLSSYFIPSNETFTGSQTLHFGSEFDAFSGNQSITSLFNNYYSNYINDVFNKKARIYKFTAYLPSHIVNRYELNDTFIIAGREYRINSIKINLLNNKAELELLNKLS